MSNFNAWTWYTRGYNLIPICKDSKRPLVKWKEYQTKRIPENILQKWRDTFKDCNWAILTGKLPFQEQGIIIVDFDNKESEQKYKNLLGRPYTVVRTPRGAHYYFLTTDETIRNNHGIREKVDIKGAGGYSLIAGSRNSKGIYFELPKKDLTIPSTYNPDWIPKEKKTIDKDILSFKETSIGSFQSIKNLLLELENKKCILSKSGEMQYNIWVKGTVEVLESKGIKVMREHAGNMSSLEPHINGFAIVSHVGIAFIANASSKIFSEVLLDLKSSLDLLPI